MIEINSSVKEAFLNFTSDNSLLALPFKLSENILKAQPAVAYLDNSNHDFYSAISHLDQHLDWKKPLYLALRHNDGYVLVTYVPYIAGTTLNDQYLDGRKSVLEGLGDSLFSSSLICKEPTEITDQRSWEERASLAQDESDKDKGYHKNKCRLCDRRMKNNITEEAEIALRNLKDPGDCVQLSVDALTNTLILNFSHPSLPPTSLSSLLPPTHPSFTFYMHPTNHTTYFIFCSPDCASVQERMKHTMAIAGLVNIIAKEAGITVDQKIEIHEREELEFEEGDGRVGRFRSVFAVRGSTRVGTESTWEGMPVV